MRVFGCRRALSTQRLQLGTGIATIYTRTPSLLAMTAATLDQVSGQRAILGLGIGHKVGIEQGHGVVFDKPLRRMREYVSILRAILCGENIPETTVCPVKRFRLEFTPERATLPIYIAALGPRMCQLAGEMADGVLMNWATTDYVKEAIDNVRLGAARAARKPEDIEIACYIRAAVGPDEQAVTQALARETVRYISLDFYRQMFNESGFAEDTEAVMKALPQGVEAAAAQISQRMLQGVAIMGGPEACRKRIEEYRALGVVHPVVAPVPVGPNVYDSWTAVIQTFAA
jgi:alkanesulfonate monooxygenase SsuD/methylene tetrahydromethanopterin reductase-like flavin-dependent oxidoreductase (luciferase family)